MEGKLNPQNLITHSLKLLEPIVGLSIIRDKTEDYCKVMISTK